jgi:hypothetical protein
MQNSDPYNPFDDSMQPDPSRGPGSTSTTTGTVDRMKETASEMKNKASEVGRSAGAQWGVQQNSGHEQVVD